MKLHFEPNLDYQLEAIEAVCGLFRGQDISRTEFTVMRDPAEEQLRSGVMPGDLAVGNHLTLPDDDVFANLRDVQTRNGIAPSDQLESGDFTIEMETGTGKTYVYLRTIFELHKRFGFSKFVIVVPSIAIKEGVYTSLQVMADHFKGLYAGAPFDFFLYDSARLGQVRSFAASAHIQIMVVTVGAINKKDINNLYKANEKVAGERPIDLIRAARPIVIVDEPQSVDGGLSGAGKQALAAMHPLCTLRYSATHVNTHHMVYRLDAIDAYERKLVKQIEVAAATVEGAHSTPFIRLVSVSNRRGAITATVELDEHTPFGVRRRAFVVSDGDDLLQRTGRDVYANCRIGTIGVASGRESVELRLPHGEHVLTIGERWGDVDTLALQREMIRRTITEHLDKEMRLRAQGIKVLSLFFIDQVARYRQYDAEDRPTKGDYARIFEEEYGRLAQQADYQTLFSDGYLPHAPANAHGGYFSVDKRTRRVVDTVESSQAGREAAEQAYHLILKDKERLLSVDTPLRFIFSHSALREGWDNPNIFQLCTLREIHTERERRQTIGRGLRLCVNQRGERVASRDVNVLTVIANESYEQFAQGLQREIAQDIGASFDATRLVVANADERRRRAASAPPNAVMTPWTRSTRNAARQADFDNEQLIEWCITSLRTAPPIAAPRLRWSHAIIAIGKAGVQAAEHAEAHGRVLETTDVVLPDILTQLQDRTQLTRRTICRVLIHSQRLDDFRRNPQAFITLATEIMNRCKQHAIANGSKVQQALAAD